MWNVVLLKKEREPVQIEREILSREIVGGPQISCESQILPNSRPACK